MAKAAAMAGLVCLVFGFAFAVWTAASKPQQYGGHDSQQYKRQAAQRANGGTAIQINCDPNCSADQSSDSGNGSIGKFLTRFINDPVTIATLLLVFVVIWQVREARLSSERQLRAYVFVRTARFDRPDTRDGDQREWPLRLTFRNSGQTPAYAVTIKFETLLGPPKPMDEVLVFGEKADVSPTSAIGPDDRPTIRLGGLEPGYDKFISAQQTGLYCYVWGQVDYTDAFGRRHFTKFQMWQNFMAVHQFGFCQVGNATDDEFPERWWQKPLTRWRGKRASVHARKQS